MTKQPIHRIEALTAFALALAQFVYSSQGDAVRVGHHLPTVRTTQRLDPLDHLLLHQRHPLIGVVVNGLDLLDLFQSALQHSFNATAGYWRQMVKKHRRIPLTLCYR